MKITHLLVIAAVLTTGFSSCKKEQEVRTVEEDRAALNLYLAKNNISVTPTESGVYYIPKKSGDGFAAKTGEFLIYDYSLSTIEGEVLDSDNEYFYFRKYENIIPGLVEAFDKMVEGDEATIIVPPSEAYGSKGTDGIEPNMTLVFDIKMKEVRGELEEKARMNKFVSDSGINVAPTEEGIYFIEKSSGTGDSIQQGSILHFHYKVTFFNGTVLDESPADKPFRYIHGITEVISGVKKGISMMKKGGSAQLILPYYEAYGEDGRPEFYPYTYHVYPYSNLVFDIELVEE